MKEIGELLKQKRLELGFTIEYVSAKTRLSVPHIKAIEAGNLDYFKNDLPYLRYFLRSYCDLVELDFDEVKNKLQFSIDDYTSTFALKTIKEHQKSEANTQSHKLTDDSPKKKTNVRPLKSGSKQKSKIDFSLVSFLSIIVIIVAVLVVIAGYYLVQNLNKPSNPVVTPPIVNPIPTPNPDPVEPGPVNPDPIPSGNLTVDKKDASTYVINGYGDTKEIKILVDFVPRAWFLATKNGVALSTPASKVYESGEKVEIVLDSTLDKTLELRIGYFDGMKFKVNDVDVVLDDTIANDPGSRTIVFEIGGK